MPRGDIKTSVGLDVQINQRHQCQQRSQQGVEEKLERRINFVRTAPNTNDQIHGDQGGFEKYVKQQAIQGTKDANHQARENQKRSHVLVHFAGDHFPSGNHYHHVDERSEQHKPK